MKIKGKNTKDICVVVEISDDMLEAAYKAIASQIDLDQFGLHGSVIVFPILEALESSATYDIRFRVSEGDH